MDRDEVVLLHMQMYTHIHEILVKALHKALSQNAHKYNYEYPQNKTCIYDKTAHKEMLSCSIKSFTLHFIVFEHIFHPWIRIIYSHNIEMLIKIK